MNDVIVSRDKLLKGLEEVQHGLSKRDIVDQSSCFVFKKGRVHTYNQEVYCSAKTYLPKELEGAVQAEKMIAMLRKMGEESLTLSVTGEALVIKGKNRETVEFPFQKDVLLPFDEIEVPSKWFPINKDFTDAIGIVEQSASQDQSEQIASCVHIHPKFVEASDGRQICRYRLKTGVSGSFLVRRDSIKFITTIELTEMAETENCLHFRGASGLVVSARLYKDEYQDMGPALKEEGEMIVLPKSLKDVMEKVEIITQVDKDNNYASFELEENQITVTGVSTAGKYKKKFKAKYVGKPLKFRVPPKLMIEVLRRHSDVQITKTLRMKISGGKFVYMAALSRSTSDA
jgi:DNA polymerase III sliding clamp (beta) subunit (PCNA family)